MLMLQACKQKALKRACVLQNCQDILMAAAAGGVLATVKVCSCTWPWPPQWHASLFASCRVVWLWDSIKAKGKRAGSCHAFMYHGNVLKLAARCSHRHCHSRRGQTPVSLAWRQIWFSLRPWAGFVHLCAGGCMHIHVSTGQKCLKASGHFVASVTAEFTNGRQARRQRSIYFYLVEVAISTPTPSETPAANLDAHHRSCGTT